VILLIKIGLGEINLKIVADHLLFVKCTIIILEFLGYHIFLSLLSRAYLY